MSLGQHATCKTAVIEGNLWDTVSEFRCSETFSFNPMFYELSPSRLPMSLLFLCLHGQI